MSSAEAYLPLLRMSIGLQSDPNERGEVKEMEPERKEWLKEAMANMLRSPVDDMKLVLKTVQEGETEDEKVEALENLVSFVEQIDLARDLHKIGGLKVIVSLLEDPSHRIRAGAAQVLGSTVHNNPEPQKWASELGALEALTKMISRDDATPVELTKAMFGISSLIRHNDLETVRYVKDFKGVALIVDILKKKDEESKLLPAKKKAVFALLYLVMRAPAIVPSSASYIVPVLSNELTVHAEDPDFRDHALKVLQIYGKHEKVELESDQKKSAVESAKKTLAVSKREEDDSSVEICEELIAVWRIDE